MTQLPEYKLFDRWASTKISVATKVNGGPPTFVTYGRVRIFGAVMSRNKLPVIAKSPVIIATADCYD